MNYKIDNLVRGTRIISFEEVEVRRFFQKTLEDIVLKEGFKQIILPNIQMQKIYTEKAGNEVLDQMYTFHDKKGRELCLPPEGTAIIQEIADKHFKTEKDVKLFYFQPFYRYERPQKGRYREFYQFGVEWLNPSNLEKAITELQNLSETLVKIFTNNFQLNKSVKRGLAYYLNNEGWEIECEELGSQKQVCGGGVYKQGVGFALGFDRLMLLEK